MKPAPLTSHGQDNDTAIISHLGVPTMQSAEVERQQAVSTRSMDRTDAAPVKEEAPSVEKGADTDQQLAAKVISTSVVE